jgi:hypothetical protein
MAIVTLKLDIDDPTVIRDVFVKENVKFEDYVSRVVNSRLHDMKSMRNDMELFREYLSMHPRNKQPLWLYAFKLRRSLGWTHSHLLDVEDNILGARIANED